MRSRILDEEDPEGFGGSPERPSSPVSSPSSPRAPQRWHHHDTSAVILNPSSSTLNAGVICLVQCLFDGQGKPGYICLTSGRVDSHALTVAANTDPCFCMMLKSPEKSTISLLCDHQPVCCVCSWHGVSLSFYVTVHHLPMKEWVQAEHCKTLAERHAMMLLETALRLSSFVAGLPVRRLLMCSCL